MTISTLRNQIKELKTHCEVNANQLQVVQSEAMGLKQLVNSEQLAKRAVQSAHDALKAKLDILQSKQESLIRSADLDSLKQRLEDVSRQKDEAEHKNQSFLQESTILHQKIVDMQQEMLNRCKDGSTPATESKVRGLQDAIFAAEERARSAEELALKLRKDIHLWKMWREKLAHHVTSGPSNDFSNAQTGTDPDILENGISERSVSPVRVCLQWACNCSS